MVLVGSRPHRLGLGKAGEGLIPCSVNNAGTSVRAALLLVRNAAHRSSSRHLALISELQGWIQPSVATVPGSKQQWFTPDSGVAISPCFSTRSCWGFPCFLSWLQLAF